MFYAIVIVCSLVTEECLQFDDNLGPYATKAKCAERTYEMVPSAKWFWERNGVPGPTRVTQHCRQDGKGA